MKAWGERLHLEFVLASGDMGPEIVLEGVPEGERISSRELEGFIRRCMPEAVPWAVLTDPLPRIRVREGLQNDRITSSRIVLSFSDARPGQSHPAPHVPRPGCGDLAAYRKWGLELDLGDLSPWGEAYRVLFCAAGGIALQLLERRGIVIAAHAASVGLVRDHRFDPSCVDVSLLRQIRERSFPVIAEAQGLQMIQRILREKAAGNSVGGSVEACVLGLPEGLGGPWDQALETQLCRYLYALPAIRGVEFGNGFGVSALTGSQNNDALIRREEGIGHATNHSGGIESGMTTGQPLILRCAVQPTAQIASEQESFDLATGERVVLVGHVEDENRPRGRHEKPFEPVPEKTEIQRGRHEQGDDTVTEISDGFVDLRTGETVRLVELGKDLEPCLVPTLVPLVEAALALCLLDVLQAEHKPQTLEELRGEIAGIDREMTALFARRMDAARRVGLYKKRMGMQVLDPAQEERVLQRVRSRLPEELAGYGSELYTTLMRLSRAYQSEDEKHD